MAFSTSDTIVAIATPPGRGGIGVVRLSGPAALSIASELLTHGRALEPRRATFTRVAGIDQIVATSFPAPASYTGEEVVELSAHGSPVVLRAIVSAAVAAGARLAEPGEFTLRAFLNGRIDLVQAEAIADLIDAVTPLQARAAFDQLEGTLTTAIGAIDAALFDLIARLEASIDFPEEGFHFIDPLDIASAIDSLIEQTTALLRRAERGRLIREGLHVAIVGAPNVGKSSLFNALAGAPRAIVTDVPGTTRDLVTEIVEMNGVRATLVDTAGFRQAGDAVELEGVERARLACEAADVVLLVVDRSRPLDDTVDAEVRSRARRCKVLCVANKSDLPAAWQRDDAIEVSATSGAGLDLLREHVIAALDVERLRDGPDITNARHIALVCRADAALKRARRAIEEEGIVLSEEFLLADLEDARSALEEVSGRRAPEDLLEHIFSRFCVGK